jgi:hypothetical protein
MTTCYVFAVASSAPLATVVASGLRLTFEFRKGFPADWMHASLAHANWNFHRSQAC